MLLRLPTIFPKVSNSKGNLDSFDELRFATSMMAYRENETFRSETSVCFGCGRCNWDQSLFALIANKGGPSSNISKYSILRMPQNRLLFLTSLWKTCESSAGIKARNETGRGEVVRMESARSSKKAWCSHILQSSCLEPWQDKHQEVIVLPELDNNPQMRHMVKIPNPNLAWGSPRELSSGGAWSFGVAVFRGTLSQNLLAFQRHPLQGHAPAPR